MADVFSHSIYLASNLGQENSYSLGWAQDRKERPRRTLFRDLTQITTTTKTSPKKRFKKNELSIVVHFLAVLCKTTARNNPKVCVVWRTS